MQARKDENSTTYGNMALDFLKNLTDQSIPNYTMSGSAAFLFELTSKATQYEGAELSSWILFFSALGFAGLGLKQYGLNNAANTVSDCCSTMFNKVSGAAPKQVTSENNDTPTPKKDM